MSRKLTQQEFIEKAMLLHGDKYIYDKSIYNGLTALIIITCRIHKDFLQLASHHLQGKGCRKCGNIQGHKLLLCSQEEFIEKSIAVHGNKYAYEKAVYTNCKVKLPIYCFIHKKYFYQSPLAH
jgi:hypothetical protein